MERTVEILRVRARARAGYTLVELMMIVMIIGISVLAFTPGFSRAMADRRVSLATRELIRVGRRARADTFGYLRAHLLWINPAAGTIQLLRGPTNSCALPTDWANTWGDCATSATATSGQRCVENVFLSSVSGPIRTITMFEETIVGGATSYSSIGRALCFQPSGVMLYGSGSNITSATNTLASANVSGVGGINGGFIFSLVGGTAQPGTSADQRVHRVLFPMGSSARALR